MCVYRHKRSLPAGLWVPFWLFDGPVFALGRLALPDWLAASGVFRLPAVADWSPLAIDVIDMTKETTFTSYPKYV